MGSFKLKILSAVTCIAIASVNLQALSFEDFQKEQNKEYQQYKDNLEKEFKAYKQAYEESFKEFSTELGKKWPQTTPDITTKHKWVEYSEDLNSKKAIDYEKKELSFEVIAKNEEEAKKKIAAMFDDTFSKDVSQASNDDILKKKIYKKLKKKKPAVKSNQKLISDIIRLNEKIRLKDQIKKQSLIKVKHNGKFIYKANVKLPSDSSVRKAKEFKADVINSSNKEQIPASLIFAIMHSESSFNPMARSHIPAFGLMQIVPRTAGIDSYKYLYKKKKLLSSSYLYNSSNNIKIGSAYLHILYYSYLKKIKDPQSRLYCAIAAYNTGAGNVAKAFIGSTNINRASQTINTMSSDDVFKKLMRNLPYNETKKYLSKVNKRVSAYHKWLGVTQ
jgi:membrane-bound lytic murein transglycosylase C